MATTFLKPKNNGVTTLNGALDISQTDVDVVDGSVFPTTYPFHVTCENEIMEVTDNTTNTLTVATRGTIESTSAATHEDGTSIRLLITAEAITEIHTAVNALENGVVNKADFNATTFLYATADDTPQPKTPAEVMAILSGQAAATFSMNTQKISGVVDPTADQEAATKKYVDDTVQGSYLAVATIENPAADDAFFMFFTFDAITIAEIQATRVGGTSYTFQIWHSTTSATAYGGGGNKILDAAEVITADENFATGVMDDYTIPADSYVVIYITAVDGAVTQAHVTLEYTKD